MPITWLRKALDNLEAEARFIAAEDPQAARKIVARIMAAVALLGAQPELGRPGRLPGTRELVVSRTPYLVPYRVVGGRVVILRVFHSSRRTPARW